MKNTQKGFGVVEGLLILVIICTIGFMGWYVWHSRNSANKSPSAAKTSTSTKNKTPTNSSPTDEAADWFQYESPDKKYKMKIPDGWDVDQNSETAGDLQIVDNKLAINPGVKGTFYVTPGYGKDYNTGFTITYCASLDDCVSSTTLSQQQQQDSLQTKTGLTIKKYYYIQTQPAEGPGLQQGDKSYTYIIEKNGKFVVSYYGFDPSNQTDYHANVEKALQTVEIE